MFAVTGNPGRVSINGNDDPFNRYKTTQLCIRHFTRGGTKRTYIENLDRVAGDLKVAGEHLTYCVAAAIGSMSQSDKTGVYLCGHHDAKTVSDAVKAYIDKYVLCATCGAAELELETKPVALKCKACGDSRPMAFDKKELKKVFSG